MNNDKITILPDGSACFTASFPLPKTHWLYTKDAYGMTPPPPMGLRCGSRSGLSEQMSKTFEVLDSKKIDTEDLYRRVLSRHVANAVRYGIKVATNNGKEKDFDPDAIVQGVLVGLFGYHTTTGLTHWDGAMPLPSGLFSVLNGLIAEKCELPPLYGESLPFEEPKVTIDAVPLLD